MEFKMSDKMYNTLKWIAQVVIPAIMTFYGITATALGWSNTDVVLTIIGGFDAMLGTILGISTANFNATKGK